MESIIPIDLNESNLSRSDNFEELLEDIEAEAEICSPTKAISHGEVKQKKKSNNYFIVYRNKHGYYYYYFIFIIKGKKYFGLKKRKSSSKNKDSKKNVLVVKLNPLK